MADPLGRELDARTAQPASTVASERVDVFSPLATHRPSLAVNGL